MCAVTVAPSFSRALRWPPPATRTTTSLERRTGRPCRCRPRDTAQRPSSPGHSSYSAPLQSPLFLNFCTKTELLLFLVLSGSLCNMCFGMCSCGLPLPDEVCDNCGSIRPMTKGLLWRAPENARPHTMEDWQEMRKEQLQHYDT